MAVHEIHTSNNYQNFLIAWIANLGKENRESFNYNNLKDIAIGVYLLCKELKLDPATEDGRFIEYFNNQYGYGALIHKLVTDIADRNPDLMEIISEINDKYYNNEFMSACDFRAHLEILYNNEKLSEEENKETLIFGDNILNGEMTSRELSDSVRMMTEEYIQEYITDLNLGDITFDISDSSVMYLKDTNGIKLSMVNVKDKGNRFVIRYSNENGSALFLLFEPKFIKTETIYGLSLDREPDNERGLLILEKDKDESVYRFLFGRSDI